MSATIVILVVSGALILGASWGIFYRMHHQMEGFVVAMAGGALLVSAIVELFQPALRDAGLASVLIWLMIGAIVFSVIDYLVDERYGAESGGGMLAAITLDGIPENLALGVALLEASPLEVAALSGSIFLSNLPESASGAYGMRQMGLHWSKIIGIWTVTALLLSLAALGGNHFLADVSPEHLAKINAFAAGAVVASLATEVFPKAYKESHHFAGVATAVGVVLALALHYSVH